MEFKVFVSSRLGKECGKWRKIAKGSLEAKRFTPILFEYEPPKDAARHIKEWWRGKIKGCDFLVLILNKTLSAAVLDEFKTARERKINTLVFVKDERIIKKEELKLIDYPENGLIISKKDERQFYHTLKNVLKYVPIKSEDQFMKDLVNGILQYDPKAILPSELRSYYIEDEDPEIKRIKEVYVKPKKVYDTAVNKLKENRMLIIAGPPNVGKTAMAYYIAYEIKSLINSDKTPSGILNIGRMIPRGLKNVKKFVILFDDVFGKSEAEKDHANQYDEIVKLKDTNFLILTSRESILNEIKDKRTRFNEFSESEISGLTIKIEQEGSYTDEELEEILDKHLKYYLQAGVINEEDKVYALKHKDRIVSELRFPHNYKLFVREELKKIVKNEISLNRAIDNANNIKRAVKNWFLHLPGDEKYFVFTVALFPGLDKLSFDRVYNEVIKSLQITSSLPIGTLRENTSSYITEFGRIDFKHPTYLEGVIHGVIERYETELYEVIPVLKKFAVDEDADVRSSATFILGWIGISKFDPDVLPILEKLAGDEDANVRSKAVFALRDVGRIVPDKVLLIIEKLAENKDNANARSSAAIALGDVIKIAPDKVLFTLEKLAKDKDAGVRSNAASALGEVGEIAPDKVLSLLEKLAKDKDADVVRSNAVFALGKVGKTTPDKVLFTLEELVKDENAGIRFSAAIALGDVGRIAPDKVLPIIEKFAKDENAYVRSNAAFALGWIGKTTPDKVLPVLEKLAKDKDPNVRKIAKQFIKRFKHFKLK